MAKKLTKIIKLNCEDGNTIEVKRGDDGKVRIRHSGLNPKFFGQFKQAREMVKNEPDCARHHAKMEIEFALRERMDPNSAEFKEMSEKVIEETAYMWLHNCTYPVGGSDLRMIREAIKQLELPAAAALPIPIPGRYPR